MRQSGAEGITINGNVGNIGTADSVRVEPLRTLSGRIENSYKKQLTTISENAGYRSPSSLLRDVVRFFLQFDEPANKYEMECMIQDAAFLNRTLRAMNDR